MTPSFPQKYIARLNQPIKSGVIHTDEMWYPHKVCVYSVTGEKESLVGTYIQRFRFRPAFFSFHKDKRDYALYTSSQGIRIMTLPDCQDIGGEEEADNPFCPSEFYIPAYIETDIDGRVNLPLSDSSPVRYRGYLDQARFYTFGFVAGVYAYPGPNDHLCDTLHFLDLDKVAKGIIKRDQRFGIICPRSDDHLRLYQQIRITGTSTFEGSTSIEFMIAKRFDLMTGDVVDMD